MSVHMQTKCIDQGWRGERRHWEEGFSSEDLGRENARVGRNGHGCRFQE